MSLLSGLLKKKPQGEMPSSMSASNTVVRAPEILVPPDVDLSELWKEPDESSSLGVILSGVAAVASVVGMIRSFF